MSNRAGKAYMAHSLPSYLRLNNLNTAFLADNTSMFHPFVFAADTFIILHRTEYFSAEQSVSFRLECPVIDCFRFFDLSVRPFFDQFGRSQRYFHSRVAERILLFIILEIF